MMYPLIVPKIKIQISDTDKHQYLNKKEFQTLVSTKENIEKKTNVNLWDKAKKLVNPYELVYTPNKRLKIESIADRNPLSRSYFKLWEILHEFSDKNKYPENYEILNGSDKIRVAHIAEGPGGFMEAVLNYRNQLGCYNDRIFGITLYSTNRDIPGWKKAYNLLKQNPNISIIYGKDKTGNLYNVENIIDFREKVGNNKADIVTADGGFDFSIDFNHQEELAMHLIFCEMVTALATQKVGGFFVLKVFDIYTHLGIKLMYLLKCFYTNVYFYKPKTSRPANSEKYVVACGFKGVDDNYLYQLFKVVSIWNKVENNKRYMVDIFDDIPCQFYEDMMKYNTKCYHIQTKIIEKTMKIIDHKCSLEMIKYLLENQIKNALNWCYMYKIPVNNQSTFIKCLPTNRPDIIDHIEEPDNENIIYDD